MYEAKTKPTRVQVKDYLNGIADEVRRKDCQQLVALMERVTGCPATMWGTSIVGFGSYHYRYDSGHEGDACVIGFASAKAHITLYLMPGYESASTKALLAQLGKHKTGKACLYIKRLAEVQFPVLEQLVVEAVNEVWRHYPQSKPKK